MPRSPLKRVFAIDDEEVVLEVVRRMLETDGFEVTTARDAEAALEQLTRNRYDVILSDQRLPGLSGLELLEQLREQLGEAVPPFIVFTGHGNLESARQALRLGACDYLQKPLDRGELVGCIERALEKHRLKRRIDGYRRELESRYRGLSRAQRARESLTHLLIQDLRIPVGTLRTSLEILGEGLAGNLDDEQSHVVMHARECVSTVSRLLEKLVEVNLMAGGEEHILDFQPLQARQQLSIWCDDPWIQLFAAKEVEDVTILADPTILSTVMDNLIHVASQSRTQQAQCLADVYEVSGGTMALRIRVTAPALDIEPEHEKLIFDPFRRQELRAAGSPMNRQLELTFCQRAIELHRGRLFLERSDEGDPVFVVLLPLPVKAKE